MKSARGASLSISSKIILVFMVMLGFSNLVIGFSSYWIARGELNRRGEQILRNGVTQALDLIQSEYEKTKSGIAPEEATQGQIKDVLVGPLNRRSGTRELHHRIDLGPNGYFIIYDSEGNEIMHPSLEGLNVLNVTDFDDDERFLVREQIETGKNGGGFVNYSWWLPHSDRVSRKISYCDYFEPWDWIVVASAYKIDFNRAANNILLVIVLTMTALVILVSRIVIFYVRQVTTPIIAIANGMQKVAAEIFEPVEKTFRKDETAVLVDGYNQMIGSLQTTRKDLAEKNEYITYLAFHDDLTGLPNRHGLEAYVCDRIGLGCHAAYMIQADIQGLKAINSTLGYKEGDRLLQIIGTFFSEKDNPDLFIARTSSNEFTMWAEIESLTDIRNRVEELRESVKEHIGRHGFSQIIDMHLAAVAYPEDGRDFGKLYEKTSMTMKTAKDSNSLGLHEYHTGIREAIESELAMKRHLARALNEHEIAVHYQAQVDFLTGTIVGVEALARWDSKELGPVPPSVFIPAIDSQNLVKEFSNYMLETVLGDYEQLKKKYNDEITVSINISPAYFMDRNCFESLSSAIDRHSLPADKLILEITEDVFISEIESITVIINQLHDLGLRISIDDFGTGYSSLSYLTQMDFDEMKIDKSFVSRILDDPKSFRLFEVLCDIADIYGFNIVAEGVETEQQLQKIRTTSLHIIQGYLFSRPELLRTSSGS